MPTKVNTLDKSLLIWFKNLHPFHHNERKRDGVSEKLIKRFVDETGRCDLVFELFKNHSLHFKEDIFMQKLVQIGRERTTEID